MELTTQARWYKKGLRASPTERLSASPSLLRDLRLHAHTPPHTGARNCSQAVSTRSQAASLLAAALLLTVGAWDAGTLPL